MSDKMLIKQFLLFSLWLIPSVCGLAAQEQAVFDFHKPPQASDNPFDKKIHLLVSKIISGKPLSFSEEREFFGPYGRNLGQALYIALGNGKEMDEYPFLFQVKENPEYSPIGSLFIQRMHPILQKQQYYFYTVGAAKLFHIKSEEQRGFTTNHFLTIVFRNSDWINNSSEYILLLSLYFPGKSLNSDFFIDLDKSYFNGERLDNFLGFQRTLTPGVYKVPDRLLNEVKKILSSLR